MSLNYKLLNFDTAFSNYIYDGNNTAGSTMSPYNAEFKLSLPVHNIKKIALSSVEIPLLFNNVRSSTV